MVQVYSREERTVGLLSGYLAIFVTRIRSFGVIILERELSPRRAWDRPCAERGRTRCITTVRRGGQLRRPLAQTLAAAVAFWVEYPRHLRADYKGTNDSNGGRDGGRKR